MTDITIQDNGNGTGTITIAGVPITPCVAPIDPPPADDPPPDDSQPAPPPDDPAPAVKFNVTQTGNHCAAWDHTTGLPAGTKGSIDWGDGKTWGTITVGGNAGRTLPDGNYVVTVEYGSASKTINITVPKAAPAPSDPPSGGTPPPPSGPAPITSNFQFDPPPASPQGTGANEVKVTIDPHDGHPLTAIAKVGDDPQAPFVYCAPVDDTGKPSDMLTVHAYADGCHVGVVRLDAATDLTDCALHVEYNGAVAFDRDGVDFPRGQWNNFIHYGTEPAWKSVERHPCLPNYAWGESQAPYSEKGADYSFNGYGIDPQASTPTTGERGAIGYVPQWDMPFVLQPSADTWTITRRAADTCFARQTVCCHPTTGEPVDIDQFPGVTTFPLQQNSKPQSNPFPNYQGSWSRGVFTANTDGWITGIHARQSDTAHLTHFSLVAALATGSAHDLDALAFQANAPLLKMNPDYRAANLLYQQQVRSLAWGIAYLFVASQVGRFTEYFKRQMDKQLAIIKSKPTNPMHVYAFNHNYKVDAMPGWSGGAAWQEDYVQMALDPIGFALPEWHDVCADHALVRALYFVRDGKLRPACINATEYERLHIDPNGTWVDVDTSDVATLQGAGWPLADAQAFVATTDVATAAALYAKNRGDTVAVSASGMPDMPRTAASADSYASQMAAALTSAVNYQVAGWEICKQWLDEHPTNPDYSGNQKYHIVPRAAQ